MVYKGVSKVSSKMTHVGQDMKKRYWEIQQFQLAVLTVGLFLISSEEPSYDNFQMRTQLFSYVGKV